MSTQTSTSPTPDTWPALSTAALRVAFGIIWIVNAAFTWMPSFADNYAGYLRNAADGQPAWSAWWFDTWIAIVEPRADTFLWLTRIATTLLALALLFGFARRTVYVIGALYSLLIWSTAGGFGGPYTIGASNTGVGIIYVLIFAVLIAINHRSGTSPYSVDYFIERKWPAWSWVAEWRERRLSDAPRVAWWAQTGILLGVAAVVFFLVAGLHSSMNVKAPTPAAAAAAVSPLQLMSKEPVKKAFDARLPALSKDKEVVLNIDVTDEAVEIASGVKYQAWPYGGSVPGPVIHVKQGQMVRVVLANKASMHHSIDFHSAFTPPNTSFADINPGEQIEFTFEAKVPGTFVYHCGTPPVLLHMANGMYGAIIVDPIDDPRPKADKEYVLVQSEWYTRQISGNLMGPDFAKMERIQPDVVAFNGVAFQYQDHPLTAEPNERVRLYVVNAGPSLWSAFHVIGAIFDKVYPDGNPKNALSGVSTYSVGPGEGIVFDVVIPDAGNYVFVDHSFAHLEKGAAGSLRIGNPDNFIKPKVSKIEGHASAAPAAPPAAAAGPYKFDAERGAQLYTSTCAACHQANGEGLPGAFPPLVKNPAVLAADGTKHIRSILHGVSGEVIDGVSYPSPMPPFGGALSDADVADIANHERTQWGNRAKLVTADEVKAQR
ncbi:multicopper oxidase domain-containing protein [Comamonas sp. NLF-1-9]|uniref:multicopper oxidase domain-containing protein n=1 Tax=Comamonas sp. NLF-1-9 TaxID=2853163 RepID=UPI001C43895B|nr:multicopper oxidase domain-containing protein [Comamonas sp. NLF-1-9]QXL83695.1 multicopper oxidase domain-containing protein [Comamonas sp. NLF-1-9]